MDCVILWRYKCGEYRKRGSSEWEECKYRNRHVLTPANGKIAGEIDAVKARIAGADEPSGEDMGRLGAPEAIKNAPVDELSRNGDMNRGVKKGTWSGNGGQVRSGCVLCMDGVGHPP